MGPFLYHFYRNACRKGVNINKYYLFSIKKNLDLKKFSKIKPKNPGGTRKNRIWVEKLKTGSLVV